MGNTSKKSNSLQYGDIPYSVYQNTNQKLIQITEDKLKLILIDYEKHKNKLRDWKSPLGVLITLSVTWSTTDFKDAFGFTKDCWQAVFLIVTFWVIIWLIKVIVNIAIGYKKRNKATIDYVIEEAKTSNSN